MWNWSWSETFWLPHNTTWCDVANSPGKSVVYPEFKHFWSQLPLTAGILVARQVAEKHCFAPLGRWLNKREIKRKPAPYNVHLEAAYKQSSRCENLASLAKKLGMTERQVERWWRLRRSQDKPSNLVKFYENMWRGSFHLCNFLFGMFVLWDKEWLWDIKMCFDGYPHQGISSDIWWYYMISSAFYWSLTITQFWDVRRKDFWQMFVHHIATIALFVVSWVSSAHRIGTLVILLHDCADIPLELGKAAKFAGVYRVIIIFWVFVVTWTVTRLIVFPFYILRSVHEVLTRSPPSIFIFYLLLCFLQVLHVIWTWMICQTAYNAVIASKKSDIRSSSSEDNQEDLTRVKAS